MRSQIARYQGADNLSQQIESFYQISQFVDSIDDIEKLLELIMGVKQRRPLGPRPPASPYMTNRTVTPRATAPLMTPALRALTLRAAAPRMAPAPQGREPRIRTNNRERSFSRRPGSRSLATALWHTAYGSTQHRHFSTNWITSANGVTWTQGELTNDA